MLKKIKTKKILRFVSFYVKAGDATISPPIGPILGQFPIDVKSFCNNFNNDTKEYDKGVLLKVILSLYKDSTFEYEIKISPLFFLLELGGYYLTFLHSYRSYKVLTLYDIFLITLIKNYDYKIINLRILFKNIIKIAKKNKYKILENHINNYISIYI